MGKVATQVDPFLNLVSLQSLDTKQILIYSVI